MKYERDIEQKLVGRKITHIYMNENYLKFDTDKGPLVYSVYGDCCSNSIFYDFIGVRKLLTNGPVIEVKEVELTADDIIKGEGPFPREKDKKDQDTSIQVYGYQITTEDKVLGPVTSVFSFRNYSNGYYGGSLEFLEEYQDNIVKPEIFDDVMETAEDKE